jgi:glutamine synthetase
MDPFFAQPTMAIFCDILEPITGEAYNRDPRMTAKKAEAYVKSVRHRRHHLVSARKPSSSSSTMCAFRRPVQHRLHPRLSELPSNMDTEYEMGNLGHRPRTKGGYFPVPPVDSGQDIRSEMLSVMAKWA